MGLQKGTYTAAYVASRGPTRIRRMVTPGISKPGKALPLKLASAKRSPGRWLANTAAVARRRLHNARVIPNVCDSK